MENWEPDNGTQPMTNGAWKTICFLETWANGAYRSDRPMAPAAVLGPVILQEEWNFLEKEKHGQKGD